MKFEDGPLKSYLIKSLQPLTAADPSILANYVVALLNNNKPKKELQKLCNDKLFDFLGEETKQFVSKLFHDIEDGTLSEVPEAAVSGGEATDQKQHSPTHVNKVNASGNDAEESSDDEDDDRNHKHRRRVSRSRSSDKEDDRSHYHRKRSRSTENGHYGREGHRYYEHRRSYRGREHREHSLASRIVVDGGMRGGLPFRGDRFVGPGLQRGRGGSWLPPDQRFGGGAFPDGDFPSALLAQGPSASNMFPGRVAGGRGAPQAQWANFGLLGNGALEHVLPLNAGRGNQVNPINMAIPRARCLDFEERGFCLRGDLCPMDHGANRIVVEDVQSLSKLTLPISNTRNGTDPSTSAEMAGRGPRPNRDSAGGEEGNPGSAVSDTYDPDQPLWGKDQSDKVRQYHSEQQRHEWENATELGVDEAGKPLDPNVSVWDRIGPVDYRRVEAGARPPPGSSGERVGSKRQRNDEQAGTEGPNGNGHMVNGTTTQSDQKRKVEGGGGGTVGRDKGERAQRTLYVRCIPTDCNKTEALRAHFQRFGEVLDIRKPSHHSDRAFVQFAQPESAEAALASPEAVFGNRFIRVSWANRDNRMEGRANSSGIQGEKDSANGTPVAKKPVQVVPVPSNSNGATVSQLQKKQEELEQMKEEIRKKQEALAAKRDDFKRRLEKLAKQGATGADDQKDPKTPSAAVKAAAAAPKTPSSVRAAAQQLNTPAWGRYKLDNRTAAFRILTPPPTALSDLAALKGHFGTFGEVSDLTLEQQHQSELEGSEDSIQVTFATRRDAEKAFSQGKLWQGQALQFAWVKPSAAAASKNSSTGTEEAPNNQQDEAGSAADDQIRDEGLLQEWS